MTNPTPAELIQAARELLKHEQKQRVRHLKRGTTYIVLCEPKLQWHMTLFGGYSTDMLPCTVYESEDDGSPWVRPTHEFEDGRFERIGLGESRMAALLRQLAAECERQSKALAELEAKVRIMKEAGDETIAGLDRRLRQAQENFDENSSEHWDERRKLSAEVQCLRDALAGVVAEADREEGGQVSKPTQRDQFDSWLNACGLQDNAAGDLWDAWKAGARDQYDRDERDMESALKERDHVEDVNDKILDLVLGTDRTEWSSAYGYPDALDEVNERMAALENLAAELTALRARLAESEVERAALSQALQKLQDRRRPNDGPSLFGA